MSRLDFGNQSDERPTNITDRAGSYFMRECLKTIYLAYEPQYAVFPYSKPFMDAVHNLPTDSVTIEKHKDRQGDPAFVSVRINRPHSLIFNGNFLVSMTD